MSSYSVLMFASESCGPCKALKPALIDVCDTHGIPLRIHSITGRDDEEVLKYGIRAVPTMILFHNDEEVCRHSGTMPKSDLIDWITVHD